jgi:hypothetical protein
MAEESDATIARGQDHRLPRRVRRGQEDDAEADELTGISVLVEGEEAPDADCEP